MKNAVKQIISFILPITALILVPFYIERNISVKFMPALFPGLIMMCAGLYIMTMTISTFISIGRGTLAPWSPTKKLIIGGMYGYVRNPMIMGVLTVLIGESIAILSLNILIWALVFFIINNAWFTLYEEPNLEEKFSGEYREYKRNVHRWIPRYKPFGPGSALK
ncbi:MAG: isoprenylcysteine carboxylmethyltransferase family protein [Ferruginibacter sp.]